MNNPTSENESRDPQRMQLKQPTLEERVDSLQRDIRRLISIVTKLEQHSHGRDGQVVIPFGMWTP